MNNLIFGRFLFRVFLLVFMMMPVEGFSGNVISSADILVVGKPLPEAKLKAYGAADVDLKSLKGKIKIISVVPQLNTPVCDKQTHRFSETNNGLDEHVDIITVSTNSSEGQYQFSMKSNIHNLTFLSDKPGFGMGNISPVLLILIT